MPRKLLLADDSITIQKVVAITLAGEDLSILSVDNGDEAISKARETKPDIILADVVMPRRSGYDVCEAVKADPSLKHIPVLLLAGTFEAFDEARARAVSADGHIQKPFESQALIDKVSSLLAKSAARSQPASPVAAPAAPAPATPVPVPAAASVAANVVAPRPPVAPSSSARLGVAPPRPPTPAPATTAGARPLAPGIARPPVPGAARPGVVPPPAVPRPPVPSTGARLPVPSAPAPSRPSVAPTRPGAPVPPVSPVGARPPVPGPGVAGPAVAAARPPVPVPAPPAPRVAPAAVAARPQKDPFGLGLTVPPPPAPLSVGAPPPPARVELPPPPVADLTKLDVLVDDVSIGLEEPPAEKATVVVPEPAKAPAPAFEVAKPLGAPPAHANTLEPAAVAHEAVLREAMSKASRELIEKIAWEVVPQLAETIIREELERLIKDREAKG